MDIYIYIYILHITNMHTYIYIYRYAIWDNTILHTTITYAHSSILHVAMPYYVKLYQTIWLRFEMDYIKLCCAIP